MILKFAASDDLKLLQTEVISECEGWHWQTLAKRSTTKKQDKVEQILHCLKVAKIGKMWYKQTAAKSGINFTLSFNGNYWQKKSVKN